MSQVLLQFAIQTVCLHQTVKFKNNFIGKTKITSASLLWERLRAE